MVKKKKRTREKYKQKQIFFPPPDAEKNIQLKDTTPGATSRSRKSHPEVDCSHREGLTHRGPKMAPSGFEHNQTIHPLLTDESLPSLFH